MPHDPRGPIPAPKAPATSQHQLGFVDGTNRQRQSRGETHLTLNIAPEPEVPPWTGQESLRPLFQARFLPLAPAAVGSQTLRSGRGSGGWLLEAGSTAAGPGTVPSAPTWNTEKGILILLRPGWPGSSLASLLQARRGMQVGWPPHHPSHGSCSAATLLKTKVGRDGHR